VPCKSFGSWDDGEGHPDPVIGKSGNRVIEPERSPRINADGRGSARSPQKPNSWDVSCKSFRSWDGAGGHPDPVIGKSGNRVIETQNIHRGSTRMKSRIRKDAKGCRSRENRTLGMYRVTPLDLGMNGEGRPYGTLPAAIK